MGVYIFWPADEPEHSAAANQWAHAESHWAPECVCTFEDPIPEGYSLVVLSPQNGLNVQGTEDLATFVHPENAAYWFGSNHHHMEAEDLPRTPDHIVYINANVYTELYSWVALAIVMYDRAVKGG